MLNHLSRIVYIFYDIPYIKDDINNVYFFQDNVEELTVNGKIYYLVGDYSLTYFEYLYVMYFNKQIAENENIEDSTSLSATANGQSTSALSFPKAFTATSTVTAEQATMNPEKCSISSVMVFVSISASSIMTRSDSPELFVSYCISKTRILFPIMQQMLRATNVTSRELLPYTKTTKKKRKNNQNKYKNTAV